MSGGTVVVRPAGSGSAAAASASAASSATPLSNHESFMLLLSDPAGVAALLDYLQAGYSEHHLLFWKDTTQTFRTLAGDDAARDQRAIDMWHKYGRNGSASQINITEPQRMRVETAIEKIGTKDASGAPCHVPVDVFDEAAAYCLELIKGNYFFPFQSSPQYARLQADKKGKGDKGDTDSQQQKKKPTQDDKKKKAASCNIL